MVRDLFADIVAEIQARTSRTLILLLALALSVGGIVVAGSLSASASAQVTDELAATALDQVTVHQSAREHGVSEPDLLTEQELEKLLRPMSHVRAWSRTMRLPEETAPVQHTVLDAPLPDVAVIAVDPDFLDLADLRVSPSSAALSWSALTRHSAEPQAVALVGVRVAKRLGVGGAGEGYSVLVGGRRHSVIGLIDEGRDPSLGDSVLVPLTGADRYRSTESHPSVTIRTDLGSSAAVGDLLPPLLSPDSPSSLTATGQESYADLRRGVTTHLDRLILTASSVLWGLTVLLIATVFVVTVIGRTGEIGLRRALGFSRARVAATFMGEGIVLGAFGGLGGAGVGTIAALGLTLAFGWTPLIPVHLPLLAPLAGMATGAVAAAYPAIRASGVSPAEAVRSD